MVTVTVILSNSSLVHVTFQQIIHILIEGKLTLLIAQN